MSNRQEPDVGRIGICSIGRLGLIEDRKELEWGLAWVGTGVLDGEPWSSRNPDMLDADEQARLLVVAG